MYRNPPHPLVRCGRFYFYKPLILHYQYRHCHWRTEHVCQSPAVNRNIELVTPMVRTCGNPMLVGSLVYIKHILHSFSCMTIALGINILDFAPNDTYLFVSKHNVETKTLKCMDVTRMNVIRMNAWPRGKTRGQFPRGTPMDRGVGHIGTTKPPTWLNGHTHLHIGGVKGVIDPKEHSYDASTDAQIEHSRPAMEYTRAGTQF